jgi:hypothetical protein
VAVATGLLLLLGSQKGIVTGTVLLMILLLCVVQLSAERQKAEHAAERSGLQSRLSEVQREAAVARAMTEGWQRDSKVRADA